MYRYLFSNPQIFRPVSRLNVFGPRMFRFCNYIGTQSSERRRRSHNGGVQLLRQPEGERERRGAKKVALVFGKEMVDEFDAARLN